MLEYLREIIGELCEEKGIEYKLLSKDWIIRLERNGKVGFIVGSRFGINSITACSIASDKYATYQVLKSAGLPIIEHKMVFNKRFRKGYISDLNSKKEIKKYLDSQKNKKVVIKANEGSCGNDVYLCDNMFKISNAINKIFKTKESVSICPFYEIDIEYRVIILDDECKLIYGKKSADNMWKHNLSQGAKVVEVSDEKVRNELYNIAKNAVHEIGLRFASVDIIKLRTGEMLIIEINSGVTINKYTEFVENGREIAKKIYGEAISKML